MTDLLFQPIILCGVLLSAGLAILESYKKISSFVTVLSLFVGTATVTYLLICGGSYQDAILVLLILFIVQVREFLPGGKSK